MNQFDATIAALNAEIDAESAAIKEQRTALDKRENDLSVRIKARDMMQRFALLASSANPNPIQSNTPQTSVQTPAHADEIDLSNLVGESPTRRRTLVDDVRDVVRRLGRQEFTNAHVEVAMKHLGIEIVGKTPRSRISLVFAKLVDEGTLARTFVGGGNVPHRYRLRSLMTEEELVQAEAINRANLAVGHSQATLDDEDQPSTDNVVKIA